MCQQRSSVSWWATSASLSVTSALVQRCFHASSPHPRNTTGEGPKPCGSDPSSCRINAARYRLTHRPCGGGCACGRGEHPQTQHHHQPNPNAASARRGHGHACRGRNDRPCRRSACDRRPGSRDATRANATRRRKQPNHHATNDRGHHVSHHVSHHASHHANPNATRNGRHGLVLRSGGRSRPGPQGPRRPSPRACAWRAAGDRSCPPGCPGR